MEVTININNYLSEEDKKELAASAFKEMISKSIIDEYKSQDPKRRMDNYERVLSNAVWYHLQNNIDSIIGSDTAKIIEEKVKKAVNDTDYSYNIFRQKNSWELQDSPAQTIVKQTLDEIRPEIKTRLSEQIFDKISSLDTNEMLDVVRDIFYEIIEDRLKK